MKRVAIIVLTTEGHDDEATAELKSYLNSLKELRNWSLERVVDTKV